MKSIENDCKISLNPKIDELKVIINNDNVCLIKIDNVSL